MSYTQAVQSIQEIQANDADRFGQIQDIFAWVTKAGRNFITLLSDANGAGDRGVNEGMDELTPAQMVIVLSILSPQQLKEVGKEIELEDLRNLRRGVAEVFNVAPAAAAATDESKQTDKYDSYDAYPQMKLAEFGYSADGNGEEEEDEEEEEGSFVETQPRPFQYAAGQGYFAAEAEADEED